jgi:hypothetical protein
MKRFNPGHDSYGHSVQRTQDGGYIIAGTKQADDEDPWDQVLLIKTDSSGTMEWNKDFGWNDNDRGYSVQQTADNGFIIAGETGSYTSGGQDAWLIKTDASGEVLWDKVLGGPDYDTAFSLDQTSDGGFVIAGSTNSYGAGGADAWLVKVHDPPSLPNQPTNVSPANGVTRVSLTPTLMSSAFSDPDSGDVHTASQWRVTTRTDHWSDFYTVFDSGVDTTNLTQIVLPSGVLEPETQYYWRVRHLDGHEDWSKWSTETSFTTLQPPEVHTRDASDVTTNSARLNGRLDSLGTASSVTVSFQWGTSSGSYPNETSGEVKTDGGTFYSDLSGLSPAMTYYYRAKVVGDTTEYGAETSFTTTSTPPAVTTEAASIIASYSARLNGNLSSLGTAGSITVSFIWGTGAGSLPNETTAEVKFGTGTFYFDLGSLIPGTTYYYQAKAVGHGTSYGATTSFTAPTVPPTVTTMGATGIELTSVTLNGDLTSVGTAASVDASFEWWETGKPVITTTPQPLTGSGTYWVHLSGLTPNTTYHFRAKAVGDGTAFGEDMTFTTVNRPPNQPVNASPPDAATGVSLTPTLECSAFSDPDSGDTHGGSQWQITTVYGDYANPVFDSGTGTEITLSSGILNRNTTYFWHVRYKDNHGDWSEWSVETSFTTASSYSQPPSQPVNSAPANGTADVSLTPTLQSSAFSDPDSGDVHIASQWQVSSTAGDYSTPVFDSSANAGHLTSIAIPSGALQYSTTYYWHVRHQDSYFAWSAWSVETSFTTATRSQPQADFSVISVKVSKGVMLVFFSNLSSGGASPLTYAWDFDNDGTIDATEREPWHHYDASGTYTVSLTITDAWGETDTEVKPNCLTILAPTGGKTETADGQIGAEFPAGAVAGTSVVTIKTTETSLLPDMPEGFKIGNTSFVIMALDRDGNEIVTLSQPSTITVKYSEEDLAAAGGDPHRLVLAYWDEAAGEWKPLETDVNTDDMTLSASTTHLSTWAVLAKTTSASNGLPLWSWVVIGLAAVLVMGTGTYVVAKRVARH